MNIEDGDKVDSALAGARSGGAVIEKRPLQREAPPGSTYPVKELGDILGGAAIAMQEAIQCPISICGNSLLAAAALAVQPHADVVLDGRVIPLSMLALTSSASGERKSAVDAQALKPHRAYERRLECAVQQN